MQTQGAAPSVIRVGLILGPLGKLPTPPLIYLLLRLNTLQSLIEFEHVPAPPDDQLLLDLASPHELDRDAVRSGLDPFWERYASYWAGAIRAYSLEGSPPSRAIILTTATFSDHWYSAATENVGILALGSWAQFMAPPSLVEFFLFLTLRMAIGLVDPRLYDTVHLGTRGCLWDFTPSLSDARYKILVGTVCRDCMQVLRSGPAAPVVSDLPAILGKGWFGGRHDPASAAGLSAKLGYDLFIAQGIRPTLRQRIKSILVEETTKETVKWVFAILLVATLVILNLNRLGTP